MQYIAGTAAVPEGAEPFLVVRELDASKTKQPLPAHYSLHDVKSMSDVYVELSTTSANGKFSDIRATSKMPAGMPIISGGSGAIHVAPRGLANAIMSAYSAHRTLVLRPDDIWLTICNAASLIINNNAEAYRSLIVNHKGKKTLNVDVSDFDDGRDGNPDMWSDGIDRLCKLITADAKANVVGLLTPSFSTTDQNSMVAGRIFAMSAVQKYYDYRVMTLCGIPRVEMWGTESDWRSLIEKNRKLSKLLGTTLPSDVNKCFDDIETVLKGLLNTYLGKDPDKISLWWSHIIDSKTTYGSGGSTTYDGWFRSLFPCDMRGNFMKKRDRIEVNDIPAGICEVPFEFSRGGCPPYEHLWLLAGHASWVERPDDGAIVPCISWAVGGERSKSLVNPIWF